jgi:hypothetical protein
MPCAHLRHSISFVHLVVGVEQKNYTGFCNQAISVTHPIKYIYQLVADFCLSVHPLFMINNNEKGYKQYDLPPNS